MTKDEALKKLRKAIQQQRKHQIGLINAKFDAQLAELELHQSIAPPGRESGGKKGKGQSVPIAETRPEKIEITKKEVGGIPWEDLEPAQQYLLQNETEVMSIAAKILNVPKSTFGRAVDRKKIDSFQDTGRGGKRMVSTVSAVRWHIKYLADRQQGGH